MSRDSSKILGVTCGLTLVAILVVVSPYAFRAWTVPKPIAVRSVPPVAAEPPDDPNLSDEDKRLLEQHRVMIQAANTEIVSLKGAFSATGGDRDAIQAIEAEIADWESKKSAAENEISRIRTESPEP